MIMGQGTSCKLQAAISQMQLRLCLLYRLKKVQNTVQGNVTDYSLLTTHFSPLPPTLTFIYTPKVDYCMVVDVIFNIIHHRKASLYIYG